ncbi:R-spondin 1, transcript variant X2 [Columba livia]|uniref:R-spondin 1, transcript variant X2 n=2 Tax=Neoaves TaxID=3078114 RepID=A0A2I0LRV1_COLLI|nr:R-spondin 1, transcript variant X2 [Columba livia]
MQLGLFVVVVFLSSMDLTGSSKVVKGKRQRRISTELSQGCARGCDLCSEFNGCLRCSPKLFILLERNDIRQIGICLPSCPLGYFGLRNTDMNKCIKCKIENCESCFSRNFCTKCKEGLYLHKGRCYVTCPEGYSAANGTMECSSPGKRKKKEEQGKQDNANGNRNRKDTKDAKSGTKRRKSKQRGAVVPVTSASPAQ